MRTFTCDACSQSAPMNGAYRVREQSLCAPCTERFFNEQRPADLRADEVSALTDPTVCHWCGSDRGDEEFGLIGGVGTCPDCEQRMRNFPFPTWVKVSFSLLLIAAIASFAANFRYVQAVFDGAEGERAAERQDFARAADLLERASAHVPEFKPYAFSAAMSRGLALLTADQSAQAIPYFEKCLSLAPEEPALHRFLLEAEIGAAFDGKDYDLALAKTKELNELMPDEPGLVAKLASMHAAKYAASGEEDHLRQANEMLAKVEQLPGFDTEQMQEYAERIRHRLETREIIPLEEYRRRFPAGRSEKTNTP